jgi:hypothetical protein
MATFSCIRNEVRSRRKADVSAHLEQSQRIGEMTFGDVLLPLAVLGVVILLWIAFR